MPVPAHEGSHSSRAETPVRRSERREPSSAERKPKHFKLSSPPPSPESLVRADGGVSDNPLVNLAKAERLAAEQQAHITALLREKAQAERIAGKTTEARRQADEAKDYLAKMAEAKVIKAEQSALAAEARAQVAEANAAQTATSAAAKAAAEATAAAAATARAQAEWQQQQQQLQHQLAEKHQQVQQMLVEQRQLQQQMADQSQRLHAVNAEKQSAESTSPACCVMHEDDPERQKQISTDTSKSVLSNFGSRQAETLIVAQAAAHVASANAVASTVMNTADKLTVKTQLSWLVRKRQEEVPSWKQRRRLKRQSRSRPRQKPSG